MLIMGHVLPASWDPVWETIYHTQEWGKYPPEELIRFIARNYYKTSPRSAVKILDLGCGTGASTWYLAREGFSAYGIDASPTAIERTIARFTNEALRGNFQIGDFSHLPFQDHFFDCIIDICALQHNSLENAHTIIAEAIRVLKSGGKIFSMLINARSRFAHDSSPFDGKGFVHLYTEEEVFALFAPFKNLVIDTSTYTDLGNVVSHFVVRAEK